jgi:hypothetical protein
MFMLAYLLSSTLKAFSTGQTGQGASPGSAVPAYGAPGAQDLLTGIDPTKDEMA